MAIQFTTCPGCQGLVAASEAFCPTCGRVLSPLPLTADLAAGTALAAGRYTIQGPLSQGGMGALYLATDHGAFERTVVVKALRDDADPDAARAAAHFEREARTLAGLAYPTIPQMFSYFAHTGRHYLVMEYIAGYDLAQHLTHQASNGSLVAGKAYPLLDVLRWGVALARTLEYLASQQPPIIHHDIKPANLMLSERSGGLYLVDFGAARVRPRLTSSAGQTAIFGTPGYAAPEQYQAQSTPASDVFALAATLYHLATDDDPANHPFQFPKLLYMGYAGAILRPALNPDAAQRPTAAALRAALEALLTPAVGRLLSAPDGVALSNELELARWCEGHWQPAAGWLYSTLPEHVQLAWVKPGLANNLRRCAQQHPDDQQSGLDAALALLDPDGFGQAAAAVQSEQATLDLATFSAQRPQRARLIIRNQGRRYTQVRLNGPKWLVVEPASLALAPGAGVAIQLTIDATSMPMVQRRASALHIKSTAGTQSIALYGNLPQPVQSKSQAQIVVALLLVGMFLLGLTVILITAIVSTWAR